MKKSELYDEILAKVSEVCEVRAELILSPQKTQSVVDARVLCVQYLRRSGLTNDEIALITARKRANDMALELDTLELKKKARGVGKMFDSYSSRCLQSRAFCLMSSELAEFVRERYSQDGVPVKPIK